MLNQFTYQVKAISNISGHTEEVSFGNITLTLGNNIHLSEPQLNSGFNRCIFEDFGVTFEPETYYSGYTNIKSLIKQIRDYYYPYANEYRVITITMTGESINNEYLPIIVMKLGIKDSSSELPELGLFDHIGDYYFRLKKISDNTYCEFYHPMNNSDAGSSGFGYYDYIAVKNDQWDNLSIYPLIYDDTNTAGNGLIDQYEHHVCLGLSVNKALMVLPGETVYPYYLVNYGSESAIRYPEASQSLNITSTEFWNIWRGETPQPSGGEDTSTSGGGRGTYDFIGDTISEPSLPTISAVDSKFITLYTPTIEIINQLASYMWDDINLENFRKIVANPIDTIIGFSILPINIPSSGSREIKIGNIGTDIQCALASTQFLTVDLGSLQVKEIWGSALDYEPYTHTTLYLPYIGSRPIKTDDIMGKTVQIKYNIDILTGSCVALVLVGNSVLYTFTGSLGMQVPITSTDWNSAIQSALSLVGSGITAITTSGASVPLSASTVANSISNMKPTIQRSGVVSAQTGLLGVQYPYFIFEVPNQSLAKDYNKFVGYPSNITSKLSKLTGYTQIEKIHLENIRATDKEKIEIETLLKAGVIL